MNGRKSRFIIGSHSMKNRLKASKLLTIKNDTDRSLIIRIISHLCVLCVCWTLLTRCIVHFVIFFFFCMCVLCHWLYTMFGKGAVRFARTRYSVMCMWFDYSWMTLNMVNTMLICIFNYDSCTKLLRFMFDRTQNNVINLILIYLVKCNGLISRFWFLVSGNILNLYLWFRSRDFPLIKLKL